MTSSLRAAVVVVTALLLAGCPSDPDKGDPSPGATSADGSAKPGTPAATPVASAVGDFPGGRVEVYSLKRSGDTLRLDFGVTNTGTESIPLIYSMRDPGYTKDTTRDASGVALLDAANAKEYRVLLGPGDRSCRCSTDLGYVDKGATMRLFAEFPAPPADVKTVHVLVPHYTPMLDVTIDGSDARSGPPAVTLAATAAGTGAAAGVTLEVYDLQRTGGLSVLRLGLRNTRADDFGPIDRFQAPELKIPRIHDLSGVALLDPAAQQKYLPLRDSTRFCLCSGAIDFDGYLKPGVTDVFWVGFVAPPATTRSVEVQVPNFPPVSAPVTGDGNGATAGGGGAPQSTPPPAPAGAPPTRPDGASVDRVLDVVTRVVDVRAATTRVEQGAQTQLNLDTDVLFDFGSARLSAKAQQTLATAADALKKETPATVRVDGYTDSVGEDAANLTLSRQRAQAVTDALTGLLGATKVRFVVEGHGEADPIAPNSTEGGGDNPEGRALNRRVTLSYEK